VLQIDAPEVDAFGADTRALVLAFAPTISAAVQNARLFEQERDAMERLREADQLKQDFLAIVSHELRTPLTTMLGFADTLALHLAELPADQAVSIARRIRGAGDRLARLIEDLLYASQIERGMVELRLDLVDVATAVRTAVDELADTGHPVDLDVADDLPTVAVDRDRLLQVLTNLLGNAIKFSPAGAPVQVHAWAEGDRVRLDVCDQGAGIPAQERDAIFQLFYQAEPAMTRRAGGLGIGLYVVKRLCDAMDITVEVDVVDGSGTCFRLGLPTRAPA
jgi:signal transduction histidine kinase